MQHHETRGETSITLFHCFVAWLPCWCNVAGESGCLVLAWEDRLSSCGVGVPLLCCGREDRLSSCGVVALLLCCGKEDRLSSCGVVALLLCCGVAALLCGDAVLLRPGRGKVDSAGASNLYCLTGQHSDLLLAL